MFIEIENVKKAYGEGDGKVQVLKGITTSISEGEMCVILGPSGSGKSTMLNIIGGLESIDTGRLFINDKEINKLNATDLTKYRRDYVGYIFQFYNLIPNLTVLENIQTCEYLTDDAIDKNELIDILGLKEHINKVPAQLSGGQQQRCAIARALVKKPRLLLCDEPTGALDSANSKEIMILLDQVNKIYKTTMLIVTHNELIEKTVHRVIRIKDGIINEEYVNNNRLLPTDIDW